MALGTLHSFPMHRGDDRLITFTVVDKNLAAIDIAGAAFLWIFARQNPNCPDPQPLGGILVSKAVSNGITITDAVAGEGEIALDSADTVGRVAPLDYYQELQITLAGKVTTIMFGIISLSKDIAAPGP